MIHAPSIDPVECALTIHAAIGHDFGHPGEAIRQASRQDIPRKDISNEEYALNQTLALAERYGLHLDAALKQKLGYLILSTTYGQDDPEFEHYRAYRPETPAQKVLAFADVGGINKPFAEWIYESLAVDIENRVNLATVDPVEFLSGRLRFTAYQSKNWII